MTNKVKQHKNAKGVWTACVASKRACRYASDSSSHRIVEVDSKGKVVEPVEQPVDVNLLKWRINPGSLDYVDRKLATLNRRLARAGVDDKFTYTKESKIVINPETGFEHEILEITLNQPTLKHNGWEFIARIDDVPSEDGEDFIVSSVGSAAEKDLASKIDIKVNYCEHCGKVRHRNNTYIIKHEDGTYKQIGSNCMRGFLGITPSFWALDPDYINGNVKPDNEGSIYNQASVRIPTKYAIQLALAASEDGQSYAGAQSEFSTKEKVFTLLFGDKKYKEELWNKYNPSDAIWEQKADELMSELKFTGNSDYERNMQTLLKQDHVSPKHLGYVVSSVAALMRQRNTQRVSKVIRTPAKGYVGAKGDHIAKLNVKVIDTKRVETDGFSYYQPSQMVNIITFETADGKIVKWLSSSASSDGFAKGDEVVIEKAIIKATEVSRYSNDEETLVKNVKAFKI